MNNNPFMRRFWVEEQVPIVRNAVVPSDHPDLDLIKKTYIKNGSGLGIDYAIKYSTKELCTLCNVMMETWDMCEDTDHCPHYDDTQRF